MQYDSDALAIAQNYAEWYGTPLRRVVQISLNSTGNGGANIIQMLWRQIYDRITVGYAGQTPGTPFQQDALIESIKHDVDMSQPTWKTTWATSPYEILLTPFIFGNSAQSQLGGAASVTGSGTAYAIHPTITNMLSGTLAITVANGSVATVPYNATAAQIQAALAALVGSTTVTGGPSNTSTVNITFGSSQSTTTAFWTPSQVLTL
jgi:hypothetical protein